MPATYSMPCSDPLVARRFSAQAALRFVPVAAPISRRLASIASSFHPAPRMSTAARRGQFACRRSANMHVYRRHYDDTPAKPTNSTTSRFNHHFRVFISEFHLVERIDLPDDERIPIESLSFH